MLGGAEQPGVQTGNVLHRPAELLALPAQPTRHVGQQLQGKGCSDNQGPGQCAGQAGGVADWSESVATLAAVTLLAAFPDNRTAAQD